MLSVFNGFDFQIVLARRRGANFGDLSFQKCSEAVSFNDFDFQIVVARRRGANFGVCNFQKCCRTSQFLKILTSKSCSRAGVVQILATPTSKSAPNLSVFNDFDFQIVLARRRGANFTTSSAPDPPHPPVLRS